MPTKGKSKASKMKQGNDSMMLSHTLAVQLEIPWSATVESVQSSNETTLTDKLASCTHSTQKQKLSKILEADLTLKGKVLEPYWTDYCKEISSQLLLPTVTDCVGLDSSLYNTWLSETVEKSWFSTKLYTVQSQSLQQICCQYFTSSLVECTGLESILRKSKKIRIYLTTEQKKTIKHWFGVSRFVFNKTVDYLQQSETKANWKAIKTSLLNDLPEWAKTVPYQIKSIAIKDACIAVSNAKKKYLKTREIQKVKFRSRKDKQQSCYIPKSAITEQGIYYTILGQLRYTETLPPKLGDSRLVYRSGQYYLTIPHEVPRTESENQGKIVALDPGIRSFLTLFSPNSFGWIGNQDIGKIQRLCHHLDDLISRCGMHPSGSLLPFKGSKQHGSTKTSSKTRQRYKKAADRLRTKIRNLIDEFHHKVAKFLIDNFDIILLPTFEVSEMVLKNSRKIKSKSVRQMLNWSHYRFKQFLRHKAFEYGKTVIDCCEAYTSKTVSWTGEVIANLGGLKVIQSKIDGQKVERDLNGARGIFLRALVDMPSFRDSLEVHC
jgi:putative transposase